MDASAWEKVLVKQARKWRDLPGRLLAESRTYFSEIIRPHVDGPLTGVEASRPGGLACHSLDLGEGYQWYRQKSDPLPYNVEVALIGMHESRLVELHLGDDGDRHWLFKSTYMLGKALGVLSGDSHPEDDEIGRKIGKRVQHGIARAAEANRKLGPRLHKAVIKRVNTLIARGMKPTTACKHCAAEFGNRNKVFSARTAYREWKKTASN